MRRAFLPAVLVLALALLVSAAAMAAQGTWKTYASDSLGKLTDLDSQTAYYKTRIGGVQQPEVKQTNLEWTLLSGDPKAVDVSVTTTDGAADVWNINETSGSLYQKVAITPDSFDKSRGIVMAKIRVIGAGSVNGTFGFSTSDNTGLQLALRGSAVRIRTGEGGANYSDPANFDQLRYRVYALSWIGSAARVWYSNTEDWSGASADWVQLGGVYTMAAGTGTMNGAAVVNGIVLYDAASSATWNGNIEWMAHSTYDNEAGEVVPWEFSPALDPVPEPCSLIALGVGLFGLATRRRRA